MIEKVKSFEVNEGTYEWIGLFLELVSGGPTQRALPRRIQNQEM